MHTHNTVCSPLHHTIYLTFLTSYDGNVFSKRKKGLRFKQHISSVQYTMYHNTLRDWPCSNNCDAYITNNLQLDNEPTGWVVGKWYTCQSQIDYLQQGRGKQTDLWISNRPCHGCYYYSSLKIETTGTNNFYFLDSSLNTLEFI